MKRYTSSETIDVTTEDELRLLFRHIRHETFDTQNIRWIPEFHPEEHCELFTLNIDDDHHQFLAYYHLQPTVAWVEQFATNIDQYQYRNKLLITVELTPRILEACKEYRVSAIDLNGRTWIRTRGLYIERTKFTKRYTYPSHQPKDIFHGKSARILRALLRDTHRIWNHSQLREHTETSAGLASRIVQYLTRQGYVERLSYQSFRLYNPEALLHDWQKADRFELRARTYRFAGYFGSILELPEILNNLCQTQDKLPIVFTQWIAAYFRQPYTEPIVCSAYVPRLPNESILQKLNLQQVSEGGNIWFHIPDDPSFFSETQSHKNVLLSTDAQIYLDLQYAGLRADEAAKALKDSRNFCKPTGQNTPYEIL